MHARFLSLNTEQLEYSQMNTSDDYLTKRNAVLWTIALVAAVGAAVLWRHNHSAAVQAAKQQALTEKRQAAFSAACSSAGVHIYRVAHNVSSVLFLQGADTKFSNYDQFAIDPFGHEFSSDEDLATAHLVSQPEGGQGIHKLGEAGEVYAKEAGAFEYVEVQKDPATFMRYTGRLLPIKGAPQMLELALKAERITEPRSRYAVGFEDITTPEQRSLWIAGSRWFVKDAQTGELLGERIGYLMDPGNGDQKDGRQPWFYALETSCPSFPKARTGRRTNRFQTRYFVEQILHPVNS